MFGDIKEAVWISKILLSNEQEDNIRECFIEQNVDFQYPNDVNDFNDLLDFFQRKKIRLYRK